MDAPKIGIAQIILKHLHNLLWMRSVPSPETPSVSVSGLTTRSSSNSPPIPTPCWSTAISPLDRVMDRAPGPSVQPESRARQQLPDAQSLFNSPPTKTRGYGKWQQSQFRVWWVIGELCNLFHQLPLQRLESEILHKFKRSKRHHVKWYTRNETLFGTVLLAMKT